jgi:hypothetical protein
MSGNYPMKADTLLAGRFLFDKYNPAELKVTDILGNIIMTKTLAQQYDRTILTVGNLAEGIYLCSVSQNGKIIMSSKIAVVR